MLYIASCMKPHLNWCKSKGKRPWFWERLKAKGKEGNSGWDGWMASLIQWTGTWAHSGRWWGTRNAALLQSMRLQRVGHGLASEQQQAKEENLLTYIAWIVFERWGFRAFGDKLWNGIQRPNSFYFLVPLPLPSSSSMMAISSLRDHILVSSFLVEEYCNCPLYTWQSLRFTLGLSNAICWHLFILEVVWRCNTTRPWVEVKMEFHSPHIPLSNCRFSCQKRECLCTEETNTKCPSQKMKQN